MIMPSHAGTYIDEVYSCDIKCMISLASPGKEKSACEC